jgi:hypothetical protein
MITFLSVIALLGLVLFVIGAVMWFTSRDTNPTTGVAHPAVQRARTAVTLAVSGLVVWAVITIILGIIALVDAWT